MNEFVDLSKCHSSRILLPRVVSAMLSILEVDLKRRTWSFLYRKHVIAVSIRELMRGRIVMTVSFEMKER
jgi:hypothetical protein